VDGAVLMDHNLNILSIGEMIASHEGISKEGKCRGSKTLAGQSSSCFGIAIKISEEGNIQVFEEIENT
jgi:hypothetical protein